MPDHLSIRTCIEQDESEFVRLNLAFMRETMASNPYWNCLSLPSEAEMRRIFREALATPGGIQIFVAEVDGVPMGYANTWTVFSIWSGGKTLVIDDLYIASSHRGQGVGGKLMEHLVEYARCHDYRRVQLQTEPGNHPARSLYRKLLFREEEMRFFMKPL